MVKLNKKQNNNAWRLGYTAMAWVLIFMGIFIPNEWILIPIGTFIMGNVLGQLK